MILRRPHILLSLAALVISPLLMGQANPLTLPVSPLFDPAFQHLQFMGDSTAWEAYHKKLDKLLFTGEGQINVVHIGGSHVQADMWSMQLRQRLQHMAPGVRGSRGMIFPFTLARSNNPYWYEPVHTGNWTSVKNTVRADSSLLGLTGYSATTRDSLASLRINFRGEAYAGYTFTQATILHRMDSSLTVEAWWPDTGVHITKQVNEATRTTTFRYDHPVDTLLLRFTRRDSSQGQFTLYGIILGDDEPGFILSAIGVNGASTPNYLRCQRYTQDLALLEPDLVIFSIGINDAHDPAFRAEDYRRNYETLIACVRSVAPDAAILLTTNTDSFMKRRSVNRNADDVRRAMLELSRTEGCGVWDMWNVMGGSGSIKEWERAGLAKHDRVHFSRQGYALFGDLLFNALMEAYADHLRNGQEP